MKPLDEPPLEMEPVRNALGLWTVSWTCQTCGETGETGPRDTQGRAYFAAIIIEGNHGEGRCTR